METAPLVEDLTPKPATRERWISAIPMFICFVLIALAPRIISKSDEMFHEMELGTLPSSTQFLISLSNSIRTMPWFFTAFMFTAAWSYFTWVAESRSRMAWFNRITLLLAALSVGVLVIALFMPLIVTMDVIGKK
jgi:type II secretory pathway component PulF